MDFNKDFNYSYWEIKQYFKTFDLVVIGSGIVGLSSAISFKELNPKAKILVLEKGLMPNGASTKNAGFACFGSAGELLDDLKTIPEKTVWETVLMRWQGLQLLRSRLKDNNIGFKSYGGFELFSDAENYFSCRNRISFLNKEVGKLIGRKDCYKDAPEKNMLFKGIKGLILNSYEGQIDTALMMKNLTLFARKKGVEFLNGIDVLTLKESNSRVEIHTHTGVFTGDKVIVATNGFAKELLKIKDVRPARAQVLITKPIEGLKIKGTFHFEQGYYYFRNIDDRILFGGGRNLDLKGETTSQQGLNTRIQDQLDVFLKEMILADVPFEIEQRWSGIMGVGNEKKPIIQAAGKNILAAVRMGGMGIAIGSLVGKNAAEQIS